jgi:hypothetical protein
MGRDEAHADHGAVSLNTRAHLAGAGGIGPNALRNHLANDHGLAGAPNFEKHNIGKVRDWSGKHVRAQLAMHAALHDVTVRKTGPFSSLLTWNMPGSGHTSPAAPPLPPPLPPPAILE